VCARVLTATHGRAADSGARRRPASSLGRAGRGWRTGPAARASDAAVVQAAGAGPTWAAERPPHVRVQSVPKAVQSPCMRGPCRAVPGRRCFVLRGEAQRPGRLAGRASVLVRNAAAAPAQPPLPLRWHIFSDPARVHSCLQVDGNCLCCCKFYAAGGKRERVAAVGLHKGGVKRMCVRQGKATGGPRAIDVHGFGSFTTNSLKRTPATQSRRGGHCAASGIACSCRRLPCAWSTPANAARSIPATPIKSAATHIYQGSSFETPSIGSRQRMLQISFESGLQPLTSRIRDLAIFAIS
jgi:hypothetical protein